MGEVDIHDALQQSCDVYFYEISIDIGIDRMHYYLDQFGLGHPSGVDISGEHPGLVPSKEWKRSAFRERTDQRWYNGETVIASIGQGYMLTTPLQLAVAAGALATRGIRYEPHLVAAVEDTLTGERTLVSPNRLDDVRIDTEEHWNTVIGGMHDVMQSRARHGMGCLAAMRPTKWRARAAQHKCIPSHRKKSTTRTKSTSGCVITHWFISFAPLDNPRIAVAVVIENGSSGSRVAAPIARAIMDEYLGYSNDAP